MAVEYRYHSLEDFLNAGMLSVDAQLDDGWGASFPVRGREIDATVLFADITAFSARTADLTPTETLIFVNNFFAWISAEALRHTNGLIDKYIGDEVMVVFSKEFGSTDPFLEAVQAARWMAENDALAFMPHIGIASGRLIVGYAGTPLRYNCSVFGAPVALAARCAGTTPVDEGRFSSSITFPATEWAERDLVDVFPAKEYELPDGGVGKMPAPWDLLESRGVEMKNVGEIEVREILRRAMYLPSLSAEDRARMAMEEIEKAGRYWPLLPKRGDQ
jgi:class 3 adenylate cyclase